jgi:phage tail tape-measure protein
VAVVKLDLLVTVKVFGTDPEVAVVAAVADSHANPGGLHATVGMLQLEMCQSYTNP